MLVNNAGFVRDRMLANLSEDEWDAVIRVHLKGHFAPLRHAAAYWRAESKAGPAAWMPAMINTSSGAGLMGSVGQGNYAAAKAGIAALTQVAAAELARYGVTVNAIAPAARTRMTEVAFADMMAAPESGFDAMAPENVSPLLVWLGSAGVCRGHRPGVRGRGREGVDRRRLAPRHAHRQGCALGAGRARRGQLAELLSQSSPCRRIRSTAREPTQTLGSLRGNTPWMALVSAPCRGGRQS